MDLKREFDDKDVSADEIDVFEILNQLVSYRKLILYITLFFVLLGAGYTFWVNPVYKSTAYFLPPEKDDIQELNRLDIQLGRAPSYSSGKVINSFVKNINSRSLLLDFFIENNLASLYVANIGELEGAEYQEEFNNSFTQFLENFTLVLPRKNTNSEEISVHLMLAVSEIQVTEMLEKLISKAINETKEQLLQDVFFEKQTLVDQVVKEIDSVRLIAREKRLDRIAILDESIIIARSLGLSEPKSVAPKANIQSVHAQGLPLYSLGFKLLEAEKKVLEERENDDPFIPKLRGLQEKLGLLEAVNISQKNLFVVTEDQSPTIGEKVKPKRALTMLISFVIGAMVAIFYVLIKVAYLSNKDKKLRLAKLNELRTSSLDS